MAVSFGQTYELRKQQYIDSALANPNASSITIEAFSGQTVTQSELDTIYAVMETKSTIDFEIVKLVRVMFLGDGVYDTQMIPHLNSVPYWINNNDTLRGYWSENHMIMWMSSDWLIHERTGRPIDNSLEQRLRHYLNLKINYGYYEFYSSTYTTYCLSGLLNLADFAEDAEIRSLATEAARRLLSELLLVTNDQGVFFPAAGRNYTSKYEDPYRHNHSGLIYMLTGFGEVPDNASHSGGFLATSEIDFSDIGEAWVSELDTIVSLGHSLEEGMVINENMTDVDRVVFQWSSGAYFHPEVVYETVQLLEDSNMWNQVDFALLQPLAGFPLESYPGIAEGLSEISMSSGIFGQDVAVFKSGRVTLASIRDYWKGKVGFQQWPVVANAGVSSVYTASGHVDEDWNDRNRNNANEHLPYVEQRSNVALVMYRPEDVNAILPFDNKEVALHWPDTTFDEVVEDGMWLIGRQADGYVAARRSCLGEINGHRACPTDAGQTWVIVVGNEAMYGSFSAFQNLVSQSQYLEEWPVTPNGDSTYHASIGFDTIFIEHFWDPLEYVGIEEAATSDEEFQIWPNPSLGSVTINVTRTAASNPKLSIVNSLGQVMFEETFGALQRKVVVDTDGWTSGLYAVSVQSGNTGTTQRLIKQ